MPGHDPHEAVAKFLEPLEQALAVLEPRTEIVVSPHRGGYRKGKPYSWTLNGADGVDLGEAGIFTAGMVFEVIDADTSRHEAPYRVTTRAYRYKLHQPGRGDRWRMHWHPIGNSSEHGPHLHLPPDLKGHHPSRRVTLEDAIRQCVDDGAPLSCDRDEARRHLAEALHLLHRSWSEAPSEPRS